MQNNSNKDLIESSKNDQDIPMLIGEILLSDNKISQAELDKSLELQQQLGGRLGALLIRIGAISEDNLLEAVSKQTNLPLLSASDLPNNMVEALIWLKDLPIELDWWLDQEVLVWPIALDGTVMCVARDPFDYFIIEVIEKSLPEYRGKIQWGLIRNHDLELLIDRLSQLQNDAEDGALNSGLLREMAEEAPVIEFVNNMLSQAFDQRASDVHIEPEKHILKIRLRVDGVLYDSFSLPVERFKAIASRIKLIAGMDIAEQRLPQDGQMETRVSGEELDIRVSSLPGVYGESIVMRLLPKEKQKFSLNTLGLSENNLKQLAQWSQQPNGIILVTGPTGSGKSTTLYSLLENINDGNRKIITVENPVEYRLTGITQVQTLEDIDYTFARALRSVLRQDPDVVMIGEIRDGETAEIAIQASLTGHLVLSTLHTNDAASAFTRLTDMGIEPFLIATPIRAVMAQRLVRKLCSHCAIAEQPTPEIIEFMGQIADFKYVSSEATWLKPKGCDQCRDTGYSGRVGIHELMPVTSELHQLIIDGAPAAKINDSARKQGIRNLRDDGFIKASQGLTSIDEVLRVTVS